MCGLYSNTKTPDEMRRVFKYRQTPQFPPRAYIAPASPIAIVRAVHKVREFALVRWGLVPGWAKEIRPGRPLINARAETVNEKPSFRGAMKHGRCLVPADGFYEWSGQPKSKQAWFIHRPDHALFAFAGLWTHWMSADGSELETAAIITTSANATIAPVHARMPAVIPQDRYDEWLDTDTTTARMAHRLLTPAPDDFFNMEKTTIERRQGRKKPDQLPLI